MATAIETSISTYPESPLESEEAAYPCKGCGEILEEGKAFELAGNRWHIDCFRCNTCDTLLDSDANLLLLGDGSLICNNCTYSCSSCGNKIEDLAILTGDQAFCANCFKCRNCKRKIENLRYARTSQGIFCMDCHEALMARRRKKTGRTNTSQRSKLSNMEKSLPALPPPNARATVYSPDSNDSAYSQNYATQIEGPSMSKNISELRNPESRPSTSEQPTPTRGKKDPPGTQLLVETKRTVVNKPADALTLPSTTFSDKRKSHMSQRSDMSGGEEFFPLAFDPTPPIVQSPTMSKPPTPKMGEEKPRDYFTKSMNSPGFSSKTASPHIAYQEKGRQASRDAASREAISSRSGSATASPYAAIDRGREKSDDNTNSSQVARTGVLSDEKFKLQDAPKMKRPIHSSKSSRNDVSRGDEDRIVMSHQAGPDVGLDDVPEDAFSTPRLSQESSPTSMNDSPQAPPQHPSILAKLPKRGDSLESTKRQQQTIPRKELNPAANIPTSLTDVLSSSTANAKPADLAKANGGKIISAPFESPTSKSLYNTPDITQTDGKKGSESFVDPRAPPMPPPGSSRSRNESISTITEGQKSPALPRYSAQGDFTMDEDMARILGNDEAGSSFLKRVSNSVRHGRSYSDKAGRNSRDRWPRSPAGAGTLGQEISSPSTASPESKEEVTWFRNELRRERQKLIDREKRIAQLEGQLQGTASITQVNSELKEKRSTMVVLDTQKEIVVRELEVLTDHIATAKANKEPLDVNKMTNAVLRNFAQELETLKNSFSPQIEESIQKRNELVDEIANLTQLKEKSFMEFEQLSSKNAQLADLNNQLVGQIQGLYKANSGADTRGVNGLGIYNHKSEKSNFSVDSGDLVKYSGNDAITMDSATTIAAGEAEPATVLQGPHVVNIRKGQPKKFDWRKGQKVAKGVTKGLKGAFSSAQQSYSRDLEFAETGAYGTGRAPPVAQDYSSMSKGTGESGGKGGFGFLNNQKGPSNKNGLYGNPQQGNASTPSLLVDAAAHLYGSDLEQRAEFEKTDIPGIVIRCIGEVEDRGMDVEGIYRKSGANSQVQQVRDAFERDGRDTDISDDDLDIHAVTSGLKQYFRKLPTPLITYDVYDRLLEAAAIPDQNGKLEAMKNAVELLPEVHYRTLEYLMKHLARVVRREKENLMTSTNVAVVFAPTIMRPVDVMRELGDTKMKNEAVKEIVESVEVVFAR